MKKSVFLAFFLLYTFFAFSQNYKYQGYLGNKFVVKYGTSAGFVIGNKFTSGFNFSHAPEIEYALSKKFSISGTVEFQSFNKKIKDSYISDFANFNPNTNYKNTIKNMIFMVKFRKYLQKRGSFAPYGTYFGAQVGFIKSNFSFYGYEQDDRDNLVTKEMSSFNPIVGVHFGRQFIFAKRMVIDAGISSSLPIAFDDLFFYQYNSVFGGQAPQENLMLSQLLRAYITIGFLAF